MSCNIDGVPVMPCIHLMGHLNTYGFLIIFLWRGSKPLYFCDFKMYSLHFYTISILVCSMSSVGFLI